MKSVSFLKSNAFGLVLLLLGLALAVTGALLGDMQAVWQKAAALCVECVGFG